MILKVFEDKVSLGRVAAEQAAQVIRGAIKARDRARVVAATGTSQLQFLEALTGAREVDWKKVELFHLDEYLGLAMTHPASFCKFLHEHLIDKTGITNFHLMDGLRDPAHVIRETSQAIAALPIDIAFIGIGENGHLAFNDPPADFESEEPYLIVSLDEACRKQQVGEGWFTDLSAVPKQAISMSVRQILRAREIVAVVPEARKAAAVQKCFDGPISPAAPASILRTHPNAVIYLDKQSSALLSAATLSRLVPSV